MEAPAQILCAFHAISQYVVALSQFWSCPSVVYVEVLRALQPIVMGDIGVICQTNYGLIVRFTFAVPIVADGILTH